MYCFYLKIVTAISNYGFVRVLLVLIIIAVLMMLEAISKSINQRRLCGIQHLFKSRILSHIDSRLLCSSSSSKSNYSTSGGVDSFIIDASKSKGLLANIDNVMNAKYYSKSIKIEAAAALLSDRNYIHNSAMLDCDGDKDLLDKYLADVVSKSKAFMDDDKLWDQTELKSSLEKIIYDGVGKFVCLLGGLNTGKTFLLNKIADADKKRVIYINLRQYSDIFTAVIATVQQQLSAKELNALLVELQRALRIDARSSMGTIFRGPSLITYAKLLCINNQPRTLFTIFEFLSKDVIPTFIVDEANIALTLHDKASIKDVESARGALGILPLLTKTKRKVRKYAPVCGYY